MQTASQAWIQSNNRAFTTPASIAVIIDIPDGRTLIAGNSRIISFKHETNGDLMSGSISVTKITVKLDNRDGVLGDARTDATTYNNCKLTVTYGFKRPVGSIYDSIRGGVYYINGYDIDADTNAVTITAVDILSLLTDIIDSSSDDPETAYLWVELVKHQANQSQIVPVTDLQIEYDDDFFRTVKFVFPTTSKRTCREVLQLIAHGCKCLLYTDRKNTIHIEPINRIINKDYVISEKVQYTRPKLAFDNPINGMRFYTNNTIVKKNGDEGADGQQLIMENEALYTELIGLYTAEVAEYYYHFFEEAHIFFTGTWRADPRLDLFDVILLETGGEQEAICITSYTLEFTGAWKGKYKAKNIEPMGYYTTIESLEGYRIIDLEASTLKELEGDT